VSPGGGLGGACWNRWRGRSLGGQVEEVEEEGDKTRGWVAPGRRPGAGILRATRIIGVLSDPVPLARFAQSIIFLGPGRGDDER